ncbi:MAG: hypothetical protein ACPGTS_00525, partial [Minisyncoccia bacterium]
MATRKKKTKSKKQKASQQKNPLKILEILIPRNRKIKIILYSLLALFFIFAAFGIAGNIGTYLHDRIIVGIFG